MIIKRSLQNPEKFCSSITSALLLVLLCFTSCSQPVKIKSDIRVQNQETKDLELNTKMTLLSSENKKVNTDLESFNTLRIRQVKEYADTLRQEATACFLELAQSKYGRPEWKYSYYVRDTLINVNPKSIISILQTESTFAGGAHPNTIYKAYNYDLKKHRVLSKKDIFKTSDSKELNTILYNTFQNQNSLEIELFNKPTLETADAVCLTENQIIFVYNPYTLACYAAGVIKIRVNKSLISKYIAY